MTERPDDDPLKDPTGNRPEHPDFWLLSNLVLQLDGRLQAPRDQLDKIFEAEVVQECDIKSLSYLATQRAMRVLDVNNGMDLMVKMEEVSHYAAVYMEAFIMGSRFAKNRAQEAKKT